jgi:hypothetical protein
MRVTKANVRRVCAVCDRTLLQGEVALRFSPDGVEFVDVCPLCQDYALDYGWVREGGPVSPALSSTRARKKRTRWSQLLGVQDGEAAPVVPEPVLRRLTDSEAALVEAADLFNASLFRRTIEGVAKALGAPLISIVPLSGVNSELCSRSPGRSRGTNTACSRRRASRSASPIAGPTSRRSRRPSPSGMPRSTTRAASSRTSRGNPAARACGMSA